MNTEIEKLKANGFTGFVRLRELMISCRAIPAEQGVYVVLRDSDEYPDFQTDWGGGFHKGENINYTIEELKVNWLKGVSLLYIGKSVDLRKRVRTYMSYGKGNDASHRGGRSIWQLADSQNLILAWKVVPLDIDPETVERNMLNDFKREHGALPFANRI